MFGSYMQQQQQQHLKELDVILIGKTGNGKSATGNSILKKNVFKASYNFGSVTRFPQYDACEFLGRKIQVVDCPGIFDTAINSLHAPEAFQALIKTILLGNIKGYHAFLIVVRFGNRFTDEEIRTIGILKQVLGCDFLKNYGIIVMTHGDAFKRESISNLDTFCKGQSGEFKVLLRECENRIVLFDNVTDKEDIQLAQREALVSCVEKLHNDNRRYTNKHFKELEEQYGKKSEVIYKDIILKQSCMLDRILENATDEQKKPFDLDEIEQEISKVESSLKTNNHSHKEHFLNHIEEVRKFIDEKKKNGTDSNAGHRREQSSLTRLQKLQRIFDEFLRIKVIVEKLYYSCFTEFLNQSKDLMSTLHD